MNEIVPDLQMAMAPGGPPLMPDQASEMQLLCPGAEPGDCKPSRERVTARLRQLQEEYLGMTPAGKPRVVARLPMRRRGRAALIAWPARNGRLCTEIVYRYPDTRVTGSGGGYGPFGPCEPRTTCGQICLARATDVSQTSAVVGGTVSSSADQLRIVFLDGEGARYPLRGPVVAGFPDHRVFLLDLGPRPYERLELLVDGEPRASVDIPREEIERERCLRRFGVSNPELQSCLRTASRVGESDG